MRRVLALLLIAAHLAHLAAASAASLSPVVIIPGDGGSQLEARATNKPTPHFFCESSFDWSRVWLSVTSLLPGAIDCWADTVRLAFNATTGAFANSPGVEMRVPGFGNTTTIEVLDPSLASKTGYFAVFVARLVAAGLVRGVSVVGAPFDFRLTPRSAPYVASMVALIEATAAANGDRPVVLVSHSMGCKVAHELLTGQSAAWRARYIKAWVPLAPALGGSNSILRLMAAGDAEGLPVSALSVCVCMGAARAFGCNVEFLPRQHAACWFLASICSILIFVSNLTNPTQTPQVRTEQRSFETNAWLLPQPALWQGVPLVSTPKRNYTLDQLGDFFADIGVRLPASSDDASARQPHSKHMPTREFTLHHSPSHSRVPHHPPPHPSRSSRTDTPSGAPCRRCAATSCR